MHNFFQTRFKPWISTEKSDPFENAILNSERFKAITVEETMYVDCLGAAKCSKHYATMLKGKQKCKTYIMINYMVDYIINLMQWEIIFG